MSFGFGIGDIIACTEVAWKTINALKSAGSDFEGLRLDLASLTSVLQALEAEAKGPMPLIKTASIERQNQMRLLLRNCTESMKDLQGVVTKYRGWNADNKRDFVTWMRFAAKDKRGPREKLAIHTASINIFLTTLSHGSLARLEFLIKNGSQAAQQAPVPDGTKGIDFSTAGAPWNGPPAQSKRKTGVVWREIGRSLQGEGITDQDIEPFQEELKAYARYLVRGETPFWKEHTLVSGYKEVYEVLEVRDHEERTREAEARVRMSREDELRRHDGEKRTREDERRRRREEGLRLKEEERRRIEEEIRREDALMRGGYESRGPEVEERRKEEERRHRMRAREEDYIRVEVERRMREVEPRRAQESRRRDDQPSQKERKEQFASPVIGSSTNPQNEEEVKKSMLREELKQARQSQYLGTAVLDELEPQLRKTQMRQEEETKRRKEEGGGVRSRTDQEDEVVSLAYKFQGLFEFDAEPMQAAPEAPGHETEAITTAALPVDDVETRRRTGRIVRIREEQRRLQILLDKRNHYIWEGNRRDEVAHLEMDYIPRQVKVLQMEGVAVSHESAWKWTHQCNVCGFQIPGDHYHCTECGGGNWDACQECWNEGARCGNPEQHRITFNGRIIC